MRCAACADTGFVRYTHDRHPQNSYVARCLCPTGETRSAKVPRADTVLSDAELRATWPHGLPVDPVRDVTAEDLYAAGVPRKMQQWSFLSFPDRERSSAWAVLKAWTERGAPHDLVLHGPPGTGKTGLAVSALRAMMARGWSGRFVFTTDWLLTVQASFKTDEATSEKDALQPALAPRVLVIDDLNARRITDHYLDTLVYVLNSRIVEERRTILTMNYTIEELADVLPAMLVDRLRESAEWLHLGGASRRVLPFERSGSDD